MAIIIAFATLVAAVAAFLQADASKLAGDRRDQAEQYALAALASAQSTRETAQVELETFAQWVEQRTRAGNALLASLYASDDPGAREQPAARAGALGDDRRGDPPAVGARSPIRNSGRRTIQHSRGRYMSSATEESLRLNALQDAANEEASKLDERAAGYTAILAMLAVAIYLFGLTLAVAQRSFRAGFMGIGLGMLAVGPAVDGPDRDRPDLRHER